jgi:hypothetical protein
VENNHSVEYITKVFIFKYLSYPQRRLKHLKENECDKLFPSCLVYIYITRLCLFLYSYKQDLQLLTSVLFTADDYTLAICPGIGNTSESVYIRTFVHYAQCHGYRCVVLNHVGALGSVKVTAPRIFSYGKLSGSLHNKIIIYSKIVWF